MVKAIIMFDTTDASGFQSALGQVAPALAGAKGYHGHELRRGVENPDRFLLFVDWSAVADHMAWMQVNETSFLGAVGGYLAGPPDIKHYQ
jgi:heme-degrading monooxygenase HmoA